MGDSSIIRLPEVADGRIRLEIGSPSESVVMDLPHECGEPLSELGETLIEISSFRNTSPGRSKSFFLFWQCDSRQYSLELILNPDRTVTLRVSCCPDIFAGIRTENEPVLSVRTTPEALAENLFAEMKKLLLNYGFIGYKERWRQHDFPIAVFLKLQLLLNRPAAPGVSLPCCLKHFRAAIADRPQQCGKTDCQPAPPECKP